VAGETAVPDRSAASRDGNQATIEVSVARSDPGAPGTFTIDRSGVRVVLDLLAAIQEHDDPSLGFRYSCRIAACGTCTVRVDGRPVLACQTIVEPGWRSIRIEPLGGLPVVRDLIVDLAPFHERWARIAPAFMPSGPDSGQAPVAPETPERAAIDPNLDCITCGACYAACGMASASSPFMGPAALTRAMVLAADSRDDGGVRRIAAAAGDEGIDGCHGIGACTVVCPKGLDPAGSIRRLRRWRVRPPR
jgi:succinate dehydrogenase / fumarate reductase iron-sulfur subunit/fumarate reductase iron-sulfur subunit